MFTLKSNKFVEEGVCKYMDEHGNTAFFRRDEKDAFTARLRFSDENVKAESIHIKLHVTDDKNGGVYMHIDYLDGVEHQEDDVTTGISGFTTLVQRWICMLSDIKYMECNNQFLMKANEGATEEDVYSYKISLLNQYDELKPILKTLFS